MSNFTDCNGDFLSVYGDDGNVLLAGSICGIGNEFFKRTSLAFSFKKLGYYGSALTFKKLHGIVLPVKNDL